MPELGERTPEQLASRRARYLTGLVWHLGSYVIICVFLALLDLLGDLSLGWSLWIVAVWGFALAFHVLAYIVDGSNLEARRTRKYLSRDRDG